MIGLINVTLGNGESVMVDRTEVMWFGRKGETVGRASIDELRDTEEHHA